MQAVIPSSSDCLAKIAAIGSSREARRTCAAYHVSLPPLISTAITHHAPHPIRLPGRDDHNPSGQGCCEQTPASPMIIPCEDKGTHHTLELCVLLELTKKLLQHDMQNISFELPRPYLAASSLHLAASISTASQGQLEMRIQATTAQLFKCKWLNGSGSSAEKHLVSATQRTRMSSLHLSHAVLPNNSVNSSLRCCRSCLSFDNALRSLALKQPHSNIATQWLSFPEVHGRSE